MSEVYGIVKSARRQRYIQFHVVSSQSHHPFTQLDLIHAVRKQTQDLFSTTTKDLGIWVITFDGTNGILKCKHSEVDHARTLLQTLKVIGTTTVTITTQSTSGTIRSLAKKSP